MGEETPVPLFPGLVASDRLINAAPDLLAACEAWLKLYATRPDGVDEEQVEMTRFAVARAKGIPVHEVD